MTIQTSDREISTAALNHIIDAGDGWMHDLKQGQTLRLVDVEGNQAIDTLFYDTHDKENRYSPMDTIREQGNVYLTTGSVLLSCQGTELAKITADTCGRHDTLGGACAAESNQMRYAINKRWMHNCRDTFLHQIATQPEGKDMTKRDIGHNINFFMNVPLTPEGGLTFEDGISAAGRYVELAVLTDLTILISNCPQLNNPCNAYNPTPAQVLIWDE